MAVLEDKYVKTRKEHQCLFCSEKHEYGSVMKRHVNTYDGIQSMYWCIPCDHLISLFPDIFIDPSEDRFLQDCVLEGVDGYRKGGYPVNSPSDLLELLCSEKKMGKLIEVRNQIINNISNGKPK